MAQPVSFTLGLCELFIIVHDFFEVMLLPRRVRSRLRLVRVFFRATWWLWARASRLFPAKHGRHGALSLYGPLSLVVLLIVWASGLIAGFSLLYLGLGMRAAPQLPPSLSSLLYFSGVTFFTLGYGDIVPHTQMEKMLVVVESGMGLGFLATVIGYLPVLYQLFARREAKVIMLDAAAGSPPSSSTLLIRHAEGESMDQLELLLMEWQQWCAELMESQLSYPMLAFYRSQHDNQSWLAALTCIMDTCALLMVGFKGVRTFRARLTFSIARQVVVEMGRVFQISAQLSTVMDQDGSPNISLLSGAGERLTSSDYGRMTESFRAAGLCFSEENDAEQRLSAFRRTYEPFLECLAQYLVLQLPDWLSAENQRDNWQHNPRGKSARQLVDAVEAKPE